MILCAKPFMRGIEPCPCGKCINCLMSRRRVWATRLMLESYKHSASCFATLTYDQENHDRVGGSLSIRDYQLFLKRLRKLISVRFFIAGEYGSNTVRPHYHCALFGLHPVYAGGCDGQTGVVQQAWGMGHTFVGELNPRSAAYICGYVTKKVTHKSEDFLNGRQPEFTRMSLRPGIGFGTVEDFAKVVNSRYGAELVDRTGDVPFSFQQAMRQLPLGRYLRGKLRQATLISDGSVPEAASKARAAELRRLLSEAFSNPENTKKTWAKIIVDSNAQKRLNREKSFKIFSPKEVL